MSGLLDRVKNINSWRQGDKRAPHKPLLLLFAIANQLNGKREVSYERELEHLQSLLDLFGPPNKTSPNYPFTRLCNDGLWELKSDKEINTKANYSNSALVKLHTVGMFPSDVQKELENQSTVASVVEYLLDNNFPETLHEDIKNFLSLDLGTPSSFRKTNKRSPDFRPRILEAYERSCAICGFQVRRDDQIVGLEAAHIKWHQAGGPDVEQNGIAMCSMHHKLFDHGLFAINQDLVINVSTKANGGFGLKEWLLNYHKKEIRKPHSANLYPEREFIQWQVNEVFRGNYRD